MVTLIGGCLSLVVSLVGTAFFPDIENAILVLEDVNEPPYRVDRMLNQLAMSGVFDRVAGVVFGEFCGLRSRARDRRPDRRCDR